MTITASTPTATSAKRRWRNSVIAVTLLILLGIAAAWLVIDFVLARQQASVAHELRNMGAGVAYEHHVDGAYEEPSREDLLVPVGRGVMGKDFFYDIVSVVFAPVPDDGNPTMLYDPDGYIYLPERQVTDDDLQILSSLSALRILSVEGLPITDEAIIHLKKLTSLEQLNVKDTHISPVALSDLKQALPNCDVVH